MAIATLSIDIVAKLAQFEAGMDKATRVAEKQAAAIQRAYGVAATAVKGLGLAAAATVAALQIRDSINIADQVDDLAEKFGIAADKLSEYRFASEVAGTPTEALAAGLNKLSKAAAENNKGLAAMGIRVKDASGGLRSTDELLLDIAERFARYEDGAGKAALAQELFGKSGADLIPLLNRGRDGIAELRSEAVKLGAAFGAETARAAGEFNDNMKRLELGAQGAKIALANDLLPALTNITLQLIEGRKAYGGWLEALLDIGVNIDPARTLNQNLSLTVADIRRLKDQLEEMDRRAASGNFLDKLNGMFDSTQRGKIESMIKILEKRETYLRSLQAKTENGGRGAQGLPAAPKKQAPNVADADAAKKAMEAYRGLIDEVAVRLAQQGAELDTSEKLSDVQLAALKIEQKLVENKEGLTEAQRASVRAGVAAMLNMEEQLQQRQLLLRVEEHSVKLTAESVAALNRESDARIQNNDQLRQQLEEYGLTTRALEDLRLRRLEDAAAQEEVAIVQARNAEASQSELDAMERRLYLLQQQIELERKGLGLARNTRNDATEGVQRGIQEYLERIQQAGTETSRVVSNAAGVLEDDLTESLRRGKLNVSSFVNLAISEFLRLKIVRPLLSSLFDSTGGGVIGSVFTSIFGGGRATGGPVSAGKVYEVNETGAPELLNVGRKQLLLMGKQSGTVQPLQSAGAAGAGSQVVINNNVAAGVTRGELTSAVHIGMQTAKNEILALLVQRRVL